MPTPFPSPGELLPHRAPMLLLGVVLSHTPGETCCEADFSAPFQAACGGVIPAAFGLELIAQAAAVHHGLRQRASGVTAAPAARGLLLGSRRLVLAARSLPADGLVRVTVRDDGQSPGTGGMIRFEGRVEDAVGRLLVSGDATVLEVRPNDPQPA